MFYSTKPSRSKIQFKKHGLSSKQKSDMFLANSRNKSWKRWISALKKCSVVYLTSYSQQGNQTAFQISELNLLLEKILLFP